MIDLMKLPASEAERLAYAEGFAGVGELLARLSDAQAMLDRCAAVMLNLALHVEQDVPDDSGTPHLWDAVEDARNMAGMIDNMEG